MRILIAVSAAMMAAEAGAQDVPGGTPPDIRLIELNVASNRDTIQRVFTRSVRNTIDITELRKRSIELSSALNQRLTTGDDERATLFGRVDALDGRVAGLSALIEAQEGRLDAMERRQAHGDAMSAAVGSLTFDPGHHGPQIAIGAGLTSSHGAASGSIGVGLNVSESVFLSARAAVAADGQALGAVSVLVRFD